MGKSIREGWDRCSQDLLIRMILAVNGEHTGASVVTQGAR